MAAQRTLFDEYPPLSPRDTHVEPADRPRLSGQNAVILALLQRGNVSNVELADISLKYTSRLSDLRAAGYDVVYHRGSRGVNFYELRK